MLDLAYKALQVKEKLIKDNQKEPTVEQIAKELGVDKEGRNSWSKYSKTSSAIK